MIKFFLKIFCFYFFLSALAFANDAKEKTPAPKSQRGYVIPQDAAEKGVIVTRDPSKVKKPGVTLFDPTLSRKAPLPAKPIVKASPKPAARKIAKKLPLSFPKQLIAGDAREPRVEFDQVRRPSQRSDENFGRSFGKKISEDLLKTYEP